MLKNLKRHHWVMLSSWLARIALIVTQVIAIRILSTKLGEDGYSIIIILTSLIGWYLLSDLGVSYSIQNFTAEHKESIFSQYHYGLSGLKLALLSSFCVTVGLILLIKPLTNFLFTTDNIYSYERGILEDCVLVSGVLFIFQALGWVAWRFWYGQHNGWISNILMALGPLLGIILVVSYKDTDIIITTILFWVPSAIVGFGSYLFVYYKCHKSVGVICDSKKSLEVLKRALQFFLLNITVAFILRTDYIVISRLGLTPASILEYTAIMKVMNVAFSFFLSALQSIAPLCTSYFYQKEYNEIKKIIKIYILTGIIGVLFFCFIVFFIKDHIFNFLFPDINGNIENDLIFSAMLFFLVRAWVDPFATVINALSKLDLYKFIVPLQALLVVGGMILLGNIYGIIGVVLGQVIGYVFSVGIILPLNLIKIFKED